MLDGDVTHQGNKYQIVKKNKKMLIDFFIDF